VKDSQFGSWSTTQEHTNNLKDKGIEDKNSFLLVLKTIKKSPRGAAQLASAVKMKFHEVSSSIPPRLTLCRVRGIVGTPGGYSGSGWITRPRVTRARAQLNVEKSFTFRV
jgi:hypothetical protein